jgi:hypothetical protein
MLAKTANRNAAVAYLAASGATAVTVVDRDGAGVVVVGKTSGTVAARWWVHSQDARRLAAQARRLAGDSPDVPTAVAAVTRAAGSTKIVLTNDDVATARAACSAAPQIAGSSLSADRGAVRRRCHGAGDLLLPL